jgi:hypothetical protein
VREPSLRHYVRAKELKAAGLDWTGVLASEAENRRARLAAELLASSAHARTAARVQAFMEQGGGCRATFFNYWRKLGGGSRSGNPGDPRAGRPDRSPTSVIRQMPPEAGFLTGDPVDFANDPRPLTAHGRRNSDPRRAVRGVTLRPG